MRLRITVPVRPLTDGEKRLFEILLHETFEGVEQLREQARYVRVVGTCGCGCRTIDLEVLNKANLSPYKGEERVPVELELRGQDGCPILILLHTKQGYLQELEILRADGEAIVGLLPPEDAIRKARAKKNQQGE